MADEISIASLIISIIILIVVIIIIVIIIGYANNNSNNSKQLKNNFVMREDIECEGGQNGTSQCCGRQDGASCTTEVFGKNGHCSMGFCIL